MALVLGEGDAITAVVEWLSLDTVLGAETLHDGDEPRIFGGELPDDEAQYMPRACIVVSDAGGFSDRLPEVLDRSRVDTRSYARTPDEAKALAVHVRRRLKELRRFVAENGVVLHPAQRAGGYIPLREPVGGWPLVLRSYLLVYDERAVA